MLELVILFISTSLILFIIFGNFQLVIEFVKNGKDDNLVLSFFTLFKFIKYKIEVPIIKTDKEGIKTKKLVKKGRNILNYFENKRKYGRVTDYIMKNIEIKDFDLKIILGLEDAFYCAIANGLVWSFLEGILTTLHNIKGIERKKIIVTPNYNKTMLEIDFFCILKGRIANTIVAIARIYILNKKSELRIKNIKETGGELNGRTSY